MNKSKKVLKFIIFLIIGIFIFQALTHIFVPKWIDSFDSASARIKGFYNEKKNTIDVLVVGNSGVSRGYSPIVVWDKYGITSYNLGTSNQTMSFAYYLIKEALNYQEAKTIVLDMNAAFTNTDAPEGEYRKFFDNMRLGKVKLETINDKNLRIKDKDKLSYIFPLLRFHARWDNLKKEDFNISLQDEYKDISYKGMAVTTDVKPYIDNEKYMKEKGEKSTISKENLYYINKIIRLCEEKNINLLCVSFPSATTTDLLDSKRKLIIDWSLAKNKKIEEIAKEYGIEFIDFNLPENQEKIQFDWMKDTADIGNHLNIYGAEKVSKYIGKVLSEKYNLENHKNDEGISSDWNEVTKRYEENKEMLEKEKINKISK